MHKFQFVERLGREVFTKGEDFSPCRLQASLFSLRLGHARGKTTLSCFLALSRRFATRSARSMRTPLRGAQMEFSRLTPNKKIRIATRAILIFLVEVWRFELQASSTRTAVFMFFEHFCLHIARIFREIVSFCTFVPFIPYRTFPVVVSYVVKPFSLSETL